jgi:hypothetical protein
MTERYVKLTEESNALDYLERAAQFIREATADDHAWKWVVISLHGAIYGFAICACKAHRPPRCHLPDETRRPETDFWFLDVCNG